MADTKISALTAVTTPAVTDEFAVNQGGNSKKATLSQVVNTAHGQNYDVGTITLSTEQFMEQYEHLKLSGSERLTMAGTAELFLSDFGNTAVLILGVPKTPTLSFTVPTDYVLDQLYRLSLINAMRATLQGTADLVLTDDFGARSRIVLTGRG
jgi:hypothetical protein